MKPALISIVGHQNSGKTRLVARLVRHFLLGGLKVGTVKHASHGFDVPGKDSHAHFKAGAEVTVLAGPEGSAVFRRGKEPTLREIVKAHARGLDVLLVEGFHREPVARVEVWRKAAAPRPRGGRIDALVTDDPIETKLPTFKSRETAKIAAFLLALSRR